MSGYSHCLLFLLLSVYLSTRCQLCLYSLWSMQGKKQVILKNFWKVKYVNLLLFLRSNLRLKYSLYLMDIYR